MKSEKDFMGEVRGFTGLAPEPVNLADSPAAGTPAPSVPVEKGGEVETGCFQSVCEVAEAWLKTRPVVFEVNYGEGKTTFRVWEYGGYIPRIVLRSAPSRTVLTAVLPPTDSPNVRTALKCFYDAAVIHDPFTAASAVTAGLALMYGRTPVNILIILARDSFDVEVKIL